METRSCRSTLPVATLVTLDCPCKMVPTAMPTRTSATTTIKTIFFALIDYFLFLRGPLGEQAAHIGEFRLVRETIRKRGRLRSVVFPELKPADMAKSGRLPRNAVAGLLLTSLSTDDHNRVRPESTSCTGATTALQLALVTGVPSLLCSPRGVFCLVRFFCAWRWLQLAMCRRRIRAPILRWTE